MKIYTHSELTVAVLAHAASLSFTAALALHTQQVQSAPSMLSCHKTPKNTAMR